MTNKNKIRGNAHEKRLVKIAKEVHGIEAKRAWGSNGMSMGMHQEVDLVLGSGGRILKLQAKKKRALPEWLGFTEHVDGVVIAQDRGKPLALISYGLLCVLMAESEILHEYSVSVVNSQPISDFRERNKDK